LNYKFDFDEAGFPKLTVALVDDTGIRYKTGKKKELRIAMIAMKGTANIKL
jgi:hypothetical protein